MADATSKSYFLERWKMRQAQGYTMEQFVPWYNRAHGTTFSLTDLKALLTTADAPATRDAYATLQQTLSDYGLSGLSSWLWNEIINDTPAAQIFIDLRKTDTYKSRFAGMELRRKAGLSAISEQEYIGLESAYRSIFRRSGLPEGLYDKPDDFANFIGQDVSPDEMSARVDFGVRRVRDVAPEVSQALKEFYGIGQSEVLAFVLDPKKALDFIDKRIRAAEVAGAARIAGLSETEQRAMQIASQTGVDFGGAREAFGTIGQELQSEREGAFLPGLSQQQLEEAVFFGRSNALDELRRRRGLSQGVTHRSAAGPITGGKGVAALATEQ
jgi:hypothetical protein